MFSVALVTTASPNGPITLALVDDYEIVLTGLAHMFDQYRDRVVVAEIDANTPIVDDVDIVLYDSFAQPEADHDQIQVLVDNRHARRVVVYTWNLHPNSSNPLSPWGRADISPRHSPPASWSTPWKRSTPARPWSAPPRPKSSRPSDSTGRANRGLTERESEILALITQGKSNAEVAELTYLSMNSIKSYIRTAYRKIGVSSRTQAVLWGV